MSLPTPPPPPPPELWLCVSPRLSLAVDTLSYRPCYKSTTGLNPSATGHTKLSLSLSLSPDSPPPHLFFTSVCFRSQRHRRTHSHCSDSLRQLSVLTPLLSISHLLPLFLPVRPKAVQSVKSTKCLIPILFYKCRKQSTAGMSFLSVCRASSSKSGMRHLPLSAVRPAFSSPLQRDRGLLINSSNPRDRQFAAAPLFCRFMLPADMR